jgi:hypothetical protein
MESRSTSFRSIFDKMANAALNRNFSPFCQRKLQKHFNVCAIFSFVYLDFPRPPGKGTILKVARALHNSRVPTLSTDGYRTTHKNGQSTQRAKVRKKARIGTLVVKDHLNDQWGNITDEVQL